MKVKQFLAALAAVAGLYSWEEKDGQIVGSLKGPKKKVRYHDPLTAIVNNTRRSRGQRLLREYEQSAAADALKISSKDAENIITAANGQTRRGYPQILRGRIKKAVGLTQN